jgi:hypothetical protein
MYQCLECGNKEKFYGIAKEQGNALIFQNYGEFEGCDGIRVLEETINTLKKNHDRQKQAVGVSGSYPNIVCFDTETGQISDPDISGKEKDSGSVNDLDMNKDRGSVIRGNLWAIQNSDKGEKITWAYITSDKSWKGFHEVRSCAACHSTNICNI